MYLCRYVFAAADPQLGVVDPETERITALTTDAGSLEDAPSIFRVLDPPTRQQKPTAGLRLALLGKERPRPSQWANGFSSMGYTRRRIQHF
jgi:hypothetical protein